jgi:hypothetical protein
MNVYGQLVEKYWHGNLRYLEKNFIQLRRWMDERVWSIGGMILTREN